MTARIQLARVVSLGAAVIGFNFEVTNVKNGDFSVKVKASFGDPTVPQHYIADTLGKVRVFKDVDDFIKAAAKAGVINGDSSIAYMFDNVIALEPKAYTGDLTKKAVSDVASLVKQIAAISTDISQMQAQIALFPVNLTAAEAAVKAEKNAQLESMQAQSDWLVAEKTRIEGILAAAGG
ncbi:hypothetical protein [Rhodoferax sp. WC2427]|uniref:hypothetical protein n=1 Tax=Rhodoferax sp. WC2427 TaxID=3234144 RepID=UPI00346796A7